MPRPRLLACLLCASLLTACNGYFGASDGDEDGNGGGSASDAQGIWVGTTSDRYRLHMLVTPQNELWALSWDESFNQVSRLTQGSGSQSGKTFTGSGKNFAAGDSATVSSATLTGTVESQATFNGGLGQNVTFTSSYDGQYGNRFALGDFAGTWQGFDSSGSAVTFTVQSDGRYRASSQISGRSDACNVDGRFAAAPSDKNYATTTMTFGSATNCLSQHAGLSLQGVALRLTETGADPLLLVEATDSGKTVAWFAYARLQAATGDTSDEDGTDEN
ncbi:hypothetical protein GCM10023144_15580 [Pigmentiphaga soli]|uniref:Lipoprotein n=1 Tax=Pigmentiphaga soli TaxID=1007095 RepID=A0ABP8GSP4_9BURK